MRQTIKKKNISVFVLRCCVSKKLEKKVLICEYEILFIIWEITYLRNTSLKIGYGLCKFSSILPNLCHLFLSMVYRFSIAL